jgi:hypothetical protein
MSDDIHRILGIDQNSPASGKTPESATTSTNSELIALVGFCASLGLIAVVLLGTHDPDGLLGVLLGGPGGNTYIGKVKTTVLIVMFTCALVCLSYIPGKTFMNGAYVGAGIGTLFGHLLFAFGLLSIQNILAYLTATLLVGVVLVHVSTRLTKGPARTTMAIIVGVGGLAYLALYEVPKFFPKEQGPRFQELRPPITITNEPGKAP